MEPVARLAANTTLRGRRTAIPHSTKQIYQFLGVPYAQPPVGNNRFRPPVEAALWQGERSATEFGPICPQDMKAAARDYFPHPLPKLTSEDCLYLNIYTPGFHSNRPVMVWVHGGGYIQGGNYSSIVSHQAAALIHFPSEVPESVSEDCLYLNIYTPGFQGNRPVLVWVHGGAFLRGYSNFYDGSALATLHDVVVVTINYRLGPFGFLCTGDGEVRGNMGLLDQLQALRWLQKHVASFGGDPDNITLFGESAGGISIDLHLLSPMSGGLFHRAICESGVSTHPNSVWTSAQAAKYVNKRLAAPGKTLSGKEILKALERMSSDEIVKRLGEGFTPVQDREFLPDMPLDLYRRGQFHHKDVMIGFTSHEGAAFVFNIVKSKSIKSVDVARKLVERVVKVMFFRGKPNQEKMVEAILDFYLKDVAKDDVAGLTKAMVDMYGDLLFTASSIQVADMHAQSDRETYMYHFNQRPPFSVHPEFIRGDHGNEIPYVFGEPFLGRFPDVWSDEDKLLSHAMMELWASFARNGHPVSSAAVWPVYTTPERRCLSLDSSLASVPTPRQLAARFWNDTIYTLSQGSPAHTAKI